MPYNKKTKGKQDKPDIVQWYNKETDCYEKIERLTGKVVAEKVTAGPYKRFLLVKRRPARRKPVKKKVKKTSVKKSEPKNKKKIEVKKETPRKPKKVNYLNNKDLLAEVIQSKAQGMMTNKLAHMLQMLCARYGRRANFANYTYNEDMQAYAMLMLVRTWNSFDPNKSKNPFAFFTQCVKNSFIQYLNGEKRHRTLRDELMIDQGLNPSYSYQLDHEAKQEENRTTLHEEKEVQLRQEEKSEELLEY